MIDLINIYIIPSICIAYITYVWLNTNVVYEYFSYLKPFKKLKIIKEYENHDFNLELPMFLAQKENFFLKLLTCYICFSFWCSVIYSFICGGNFLVLAFLSIILYNKLL